MRIIGLDGCKGGWICASIQDVTQKPILSIEFIESLDTLINIDFTVGFVDIPIGLSEFEYKRTLDEDLRKMLSKKRKSSVFTAPSRKAVYANSYELAKKINLNETGKSISIQAWNICPKIKEMEHFILKNPLLNLWESHPELCFERLNNHQPLLYKKKDPLGKQERLYILLRFLPHFEKIINDFISENKSKADDILDAVCLAIMGYLGVKNKFSSIYPEAHKDSKKICVNAYFVDGISIG
jgi:predicted RNase H-like nuclease